MLSVHNIFFLILACPLQALGSLTAIDRFSIFEQLSSHQSHIDNNLTCASARSYASLYWPTGSFRVIGLPAV